MKVMAGDIGGSKTNLGIFEVEGSRASAVFELTCQNSEFASFRAVMEHFKRQQPLVEMACFGIAGPIKNNRCEVTNLPWIIDAKQLQQEFAFKRVSLLNDLEANAWGIAALQDSDFVALNTGVEVSANAAIISAGTGLGEAGLFWDGRQHIPFASEGGHTDFSPATEREYRLHRYLSQQYDHVSWERVVSGMGLVNLYQFLCYDKHEKPPQWLAQEMANGDTAAAISSAGADKKDPLAAEALEWFIHLYGVEAGNQALKIMARGGVYIGGGIAPKLITQIKQGNFMQAFQAKGRMQTLLQEMPVKVILNSKTALYGPALYAAQ